MGKTTGEIGLTVQEAADRTGLSVHTLRYYERAGLIDPVNRDGSSGHRRYGDMDLARIHFLQKMRATGMPICQLQRYVRLLQAGDATIAERRRMLEAHRTQVCARIAELSDCLALIDYKIENYQSLEVAGQSGKAEDCIEAVHRNGDGHFPDRFERRKVEKI